MARGSTITQGKILPFLDLGPEVLCPRIKLNNQAHREFKHLLNASLALGPFTEQVVVYNIS